MSKFEDFFGAGGLGYLGVPYPKASTEYAEVGNIGMGPTAGKHAIKGMRLPIAGDPYTHISIKTIGGYSGITRGRNSATSSAVWTVDYAALGMYNWDNLWFNPNNDDVYVFKSSTIKKIALATAAITTVFTSNTVSNPFANTANNGVYLAPRDPLNPDTCIWDAVGDGGVAAGPFLTHLSMDASNNTEVATNLTVDPVTPQSVITPVQYVTADRKIILGGWCSGVNTRGQKVVAFFVMRNATRQYIEIPFDGNLPLPETYIPNAYDFTLADSTAPNYQLAPVYSLISVLGNSVAFSVRNYSTYSPPTIMGRRLFDRVDFDRWLADVCDAHGMPTGVGYF